MATPAPTGTPTVLANDIPNDTGSASGYKYEEVKQIIMKTVLNHSILT